MNRSVIAHAGLLVVGVGAAFLVWTRDTSTSVEDLVLIEGDKDRVSSVTYASEDGTAEVRFDGKGEAQTYAVKLTRMVIPGDAPKPSTADGGTAEPPAPEKVEKTFNFPGGPSVRRSAAKILPLKSRRQLDDIPADRLEKMGLANPTTHFTIVVGGETYRYDVGAKTYGSQSRYLRREGESVVHLVDSDAIDGFAGNETRLAERRPFRVRTDKVMKLVLERDGRSATFIHKEREQSQTRHFVLEGAEDKRVEEANGAMSSLRAIRAEKYLDENEAGSLTPAARFRLVLDGEPDVEGVVYAPNGEDAYVKVGPWLAEVKASQARAILDDFSAALP